jgi:hypothetical protein
MAGFKGLTGMVKRELGMIQKMETKHFINLFLSDL